MLNVNANKNYVDGNMHGGHLPTSYVPKILKSIVRGMGAGGGWGSVGENYNAHMGFDGIGRVWDRDQRVNPRDLRLSSFSDILHPNS